MGKSKQKTGNKAGLPNKEAFQRMNYLYQVLIELQTSENLLLCNVGSPDLSVFDSGTTSAM